MGLDIGFHIYEKGPFDKDGKLVEAEVVDDDNWACGWGDATEAWGWLFKVGMDKIVTPVFQKELAGKKTNEDGYEEEYALVSVDEFAAPIEQTISDIEDGVFEQKKDAYKQIKRNDAKIASLRELQKGCTEESKYAFDRWSEEICDIEASTAELQDFIDDPASEDDGYAKAKYVEKLLERLKDYVAEDKYYVIPYYSY
jgi:hypothetical protein